MTKPKKNRANGKKNNNKNELKPKTQRRNAFKFDAKQILKERQAEKELEKNKEQIDEQMKIVDELFQAEVNDWNAHQKPEVQETERVSFDLSKYNIPIDDDPNCSISESCAKRFSVMSDERNELLAVIHFNYLIKENWSIKFEDVQKIIYNWVADSNKFINKQWSECKMNSDKIGKHNFELVLKFIWTSILRNNNEFSYNNLLTLASFAVTLSFDHRCGQMNNLVQKLFKTCIETFSLKDDETVLILFAQELYSQYNEDELSKLIVHLFLPLESDLSKKMYTYLTYKLFRSLLEKSNMNVFPTNTTDWFVQDLVNRDYFKLKPNNVLKNVIKLLEHVVIIFNLYEHEKKLKEMYEFLSSLVKSAAFSGSLIYINILDQWKFRLMRLHVLQNKPF